MRRGRHGGVREELAEGIKRASTASCCIKLVRIALEAQAIFCRRRHQARRPTA